MELIAYFFALILGFILGATFEMSKKNKHIKEIDDDKLLENIRSQQQKDPN